MSYNVEDIDKIVSFTSWSDKKKIDKLCTSTVKKDL